MKMQALALAFLAATAIGGLAWVFLYPLLSGEKKAENRRASIAKPEPTARQVDKTQRSRREQVEGSLKELEARRQKEKKVPLSSAPHPGRPGLVDTEIHDRLRRSGRRLLRARDLVRRRTTRRDRAGLRRRLRPAALGPQLSQEAPREELSQGPARRRRRHRARHQGGPAAVRVASRSSPPTRRSRCKSEFLAIIETQAIGMPLGEACARLFERMPVPEANFFGIVIAIQQKSGGNLSEALGNLSKVLRDRKKMADKIQAMSMEAKASAGIIGSLPPIVMLLVYISTPAIHLAAVDPSDRPVDAGRLRDLDVHRHLRDEENDQFRLLRVQHDRFPGRQAPRLRTS